MTWWYPRTPAGCGHGGRRQSSRRRARHCGPPEDSPVPRAGSARTRPRERPRGSRQRWPSPLRPLRELRHDFQVLIDLRHDAGPADFDDDVGHGSPCGAAAGINPAAVDLPDGAGGERSVVERGQQLVRRGAEFLADDGPDPGHRNGRRSVLELRELRGVFRREDIGAGGDDLPELDVDGAEILQRQPDPHRQGHAPGLTPVRGGAALAQTRRSSPRWPSTKPSPCLVRVSTMYRNRSRRALMPPHYTGPVRRPGSR